MPNQHHEPATTTPLLPELLDLVAAHLYLGTRSSKEGCSACSLVCKEFQASFRPFVFQKVEIRYVGILRRFSALLRNSPTIGAYVRVLDIASNWGWDESWEEDFSAVAHQLINLQDLSFSILRAETLIGHTDILRRAITSIFSYPSIRSISLRGEIVFAISPRLLLSSLKKVHVVPGHNPTRDLGYWENLNDAYFNLLDPSAATQFLEGPSKCQSLKYRCQEKPTPPWLSYVLALQPTAFANLTTLTLEHIYDIPMAQNVLALAGAGLQTLVMSLALQTDPCHHPLDLSFNTSLQELTLHYEGGHGYQSDLPQTGLSLVATSLKTVNAPLLQDVRIYIVHFECCGGQSLEQSHLQQFNGCLSDFSKRHPLLKRLGLCVVFAHYPGCENDDNWNFQTALNNPSDLDHQTALKHFPFLTTEKPVHLEVDFGWNLKY